MPARRAARHSTSLSPDSGVTLTIRQVLIGIAVVFAGGGAYAYLAWNQSAQGNDIAAIKKSVELSTAATTTVVKDQDDKRSQLGRDFLASNEKIAAKVGDLATAIAVQQSQITATVDALGKISTQLGVISAASQKK